MIEIRSHTQAKQFLSLSGAYLEANESENNWTLSLADRLADDPDAYGPESPLLLSIFADGRVVGAAVMIPRQKIIVSKIETAEPRDVLPHLVRYLRHAEVEIPEVLGPAVEAEAFSTSWIQDLPGVAANVAMRMRAFEARAVTAQPLSPGTLRRAGIVDLPRMAHWHSAYSAEIFGTSGGFEDAERTAARAINAEALYIWDDGGPVSIAKTDRPTKNGIAIHTVYTPPAHRRKGYATSCVSVLTKKMLAEGYSFCCLYTDVSNPTTNSIYRKIGYLPIGDALSYAFVPSDTHSRDSHAALRSGR